MPSINEAILGDLDKHPAILPGEDARLKSEIGLVMSHGKGRMTKDRLWAKCAEDAEYFIFRGFLRTFDEDNALHPHKPFPRNKYLIRCLQDMLAGEVGDILIIEKSRQLMLTWLLCAYAVWVAKFRTHARVMIQSKRAEDAWNLVYRTGWYFARCAFLERSLPIWLRSEGLRGKQGELLYLEGSVIWGIPQGADMFRSYKATLVISDEAAFQPEFEGGYRAALPMIKGNPNVEGSGGQLIIVSTAQADSYMAELLGETDEKEVAEAM